MEGFSGFPSKGHLIKIPGLFFSELLPQIDHLAELKVTLYCFWNLQQKEGRVLYIRPQEFSADRLFMEGLAPTPEEQHAALVDGLERAVARGTLLHVQTGSEDHKEDFYFVNTPRGRALVTGMEKGEWSPGHKAEPMLDLRVERPNAFTLYEQNIGPLTPLIVEHLRDLEETYSPEWLIEAIEIAAVRNVRRLNYVEAILKRWREEGRGDQDTGTDDRWRYISGKYRDEIEY